MVSTKAAAPLQPAWWLRRPEKAPTQNEFAQFLRSIHRDVQLSISKLAKGFINPDQFADELYRTIRNGHALGWMLGRQRSGDLTPFVEDDWQIGIIQADQDATYILKWLEKLNAKDKRYWDEAAQGWRPSIIDNQAQLYTKRIRGTANWAFEKSSEDDDSFDWVLGGVEEHCQDCPDIASHNPWPKGTLSIVPGEGGTDCMSNCKCHLRRHSDGKNSFKPVNLKPINLDLAA